MSSKRQRRTAASTLLAAAPLLGAVAGLLLTHVPARRAIETSPVDALAPYATHALTGAAVALGLALALTWLWRHDREPQENARRRPLPERVRHEVWRRDRGRCVDCASRERLEFDHIIPVSRGGANTVRNLELRCERCNRRKGARI